MTLKMRFYQIMLKSLVWLDFKLYKVNIKKKILLCWSQFVIAVHCQISQKLYRAL
jgi:hypothetical protein